MKLRHSNRYDKWDKIYHPSPKKYIEEELVTMVIVAVRMPGPVYTFKTCPPPQLNKTLQTTSFPTRQLSPTIPLLPSPGQRPLSAAHNMAFLGAHFAPPILLPVFKNHDSMIKCQTSDLFSLSLTRARPQVKRDFSSISAKDGSLRKITFYNYKVFPPSNFSVVLTPFSQVSNEDQLHSTDLRHHILR